MDISGNVSNNTHNGDTLILGDLTVKGNIFDEGGSEGIPDVEKTNHSNLTAYAGTNPATGGIISIVDKKYILKKHGNWRIMVGMVDMTLNINGFNFFSLSFDIPVGDTIPTTSSVYLNGGVSSNPGGNSPNFISQSVASIGNKIIIGFVTYDKALWPQSQSVFTAAKYSVCYLTTQSDPNMEVLEEVPSYVQNPMVEQLNANNYNIINVGNIQANTFNGGFILTNPLTVDLGLSNNNITNINSVDATTLNASNTNTTIISTDTINSLTAPNITFSNNINMGTRNINNVGELKVTTLSATDEKIITAGKSMNFNNNNIFSVGNIQTQSISSQVGEVKFLNNLDINDNIIKGCNELNSENGDLIIKGLTSGGTLPASKISLEAFKVDLTQCPNGLDMGSNPINSDGTITANNVRSSNINATDGGNLNITNPDFPVVITGSSIEIRSNPPGIGKVEYYTDIDMKDNNIDNVGIISKTGAMEFEATAGYIFGGYVDFLTKRFNGVKYVKGEPDFGDYNNLFGVYVIIGNIVMTEPLNISGSCLIAGYNSLSALTFNITTGIENTYCLRNNNNSGNIELKDFIFTNQCTSTRSGSLFTNNGVNTNVLRISNVGYYNCKNNFMLRITGFELAELINNTFRYNYGGTSGPMCGIDSAKNTIIESCEFYNNYQIGNTSLIYSSVLLSISGTSNNITITGNQFATYGVGSSGGINISNFATTNRVIIDGNVFDAEGGSDPSKLLTVNTSIHKGLICNENTGIISCKASLEGLVNGNTVFTETVLDTWVPIDLTGFTTGDISRFIPGLSPYSFVYDATNPIKTLISVNCAADHSTGGTDTVRLGISVNGTVTVFVQADLNSGQTQSVNITTVLSLNYTDTVQLVCQNVTSGTDANGFRAVSLNASLIEI